MTPARKILLALIALPAAALLLSSIAAARMQSERIDQDLCQTTGGGRFVSIPGFPGERIDRRLLPDVKMIVRRYKAFITDGFSTDPIHSPNGEHPLGLALDIVPDASRGGRWRDIDRLARWAEPKQNQPRPPFRWVGYNGDAHHGRGHHLHLSWAHAGKTRFGKPVRTVYSVQCPGSSGGGGGGAGTPADKPPKKGTGGGGVSPGDGKRKGSGGKAGKKPSSGGLSFERAKRKIRRQQGRAASRESGGVGLR